MTHFKNLLHVACIVTLGAAACTTTISFPEGNGSGGSGASGASGGGNQGGSGGHGGDLCDGYDDATDEAPVTTVVVNDTSEVIYITGQDCDYTPFPNLADVAGEPLRYRNTGNCGYTCEMLQDGPPICTADACAAPPVIGIEPGGQFTLGQWGGTLLDVRDMPIACHEEPISGNESCEQRITAPAGDYRLSVAIYSEVTCYSGDCECSFNSDGYCEIMYDGMVQGDARIASATIAYPEEEAVEIRVQ